MYMEYKKEKARPGVNVAWLLASDDDGASYDQNFSFSNDMYVSELIFLLLSWWCVFDGSATMKSQVKSNMPNMNVPSVSCSEEPDVTVIVGGKIFQEYRQILCCVSDYFDAAFRSGMKESATKVFEFPDKNPDEWELLMGIMAPASQTRLPEDKLMIVFRWADELCMTHLPLQCDDLFAKKVLAQLYEYTIDPATKKATKLSKQEYHAKMVDACEISICFHLQRSFNGIFAILSQALNSEPENFDLAAIEQMLSWMGDGELRGLFLPFLDQHLPPELREKYDSPDELLSNDLFPHLLHSCMQKQSTSSGKKWFLEVVYAKKCDL